MGKDFKSFINSNPNLNKSAKEKAEKQAKNINQAEKEKINETVQDMAKKYDGKSEEELLADILKTAALGRKDGSVNFNELDNMTKRIAPMLNSGQQEKLNQIMNLIKKDS